jgi:hypothetical protein
MKPYQVADRLSLLYGEKYPLVNEIARIVNTEELSSIFTLTQFMLGRKHSETVRAFMNLVYERTDDDNVFVLFKVLNVISQDEDALDALRNFMAVDTPDRQKLYLVFRVLHGLYPDDTDFIDNLKNITCGDGEFSRDNIFVLFNVVERALGESEVLSALKNACGTEKFVKLQTELLFKLVMSFPDPTEEILDALKNIITVETEPDLFLLFKVLQAIDPDCVEVALLKSNTLMKTKMADTVDFITGGKYIIPQNMKKMINRFESDALTDAFSRGQLRSKKWLIDIVKALEIDLGDTIYVCAGWYGVLSALMFERIDAKNIYSFDIDPSTDNPADTLNKEYIINGMRFKSFVNDVRELKYEPQILPINHYKYSDATEFEKTKSTLDIEGPTCIINTSCEHIENFDEWFAGIPKGTLVIMQNNNFTEHDDETVVNTISDENEWSAKLNLSEVIFKGTLNLEKYDRYMVIGRK